MAKIPVKDVLKDALEHPMVREYPRDYLGMSQIGEPCDRALQYYLRFADTILLERRIRRLFDFGKLSEEQVRAEFRRVGCTFTDDQLEVIGFAKHWKGHIDGIVCEVPDHPGLWLAEYKTHNLKWFKHLKKQGVQKGFPGHYDQLQRYMSEIDGLDGCMYIGYNKDDSDIYYEFIPHDLSRQKELKSKEMHIILEDKLFPRIGTGQITWHQCLFCNFKNVCFKKKPVMKSCRSCKFVECGDEGTWACLNTGMKSIDRMGLGVEKQQTGCERYELDEEFFKGE